MNDLGALLLPQPSQRGAARLVAAGVVLMCLAAILLDQPWFTAVLAYGFIARVATGPKLSPLGLLVTKMIVPRLPVEPRPTAGPPKRFAQAIGAAFTTTAAVLALGFGLESAAYVLLGVIGAFATLESVFGLCVGCIAFAGLMRVGVIPQEVCERCNDIWAHRPSLDPAAAS